MLPIVSRVTAFQDRGEDILLHLNMARQADPLVVIGLSSRGSQARFLNPDA